MEGDASVPALMHHPPFFSRNENIHFLARAEEFRAPVLKFRSTNSIRELRSLKELRPF